MKNFAGKIAFITGGASGAGLGQAKLFSKEGMRVAIGDIRQTLSTRPSKKSGLQRRQGRGCSCHGSTYGPGAVHSGCGQN